MYQKPVRLLLSMDSTVTVLITGFEPFGGHETNISQLVVSRMAGARTLACPWTNDPLQVSVEVDVLPVDSTGAQRTSGRLRKGERWDAILHVGLCDSCEVPRIERLARDHLNMRMPDNAGRDVVGATLDGEGDRGCWLTQRYGIQRFSRRLTRSQRMQVPTMQRNVPCNAQSLVRG